jgi:hypothetical protein
MPLLFERGLKMLKVQHNTHLFKQHVLKGLWGLLVKHKAGSYMSYLSISPKIHSAEPNMRLLRQK